MWLWFALGQLASVSCYILISKKLFNLGVSPLALNLGIFGSGFLGFLVICSFTKTSIGKLTDTTVISFWFLLTICSLLANFCGAYAVRNAPNPGYPAAIVAANAVIIVLLSPLLFYNVTFDPKKLFWIAVIILGVYGVSR